MPADVCFLGWRVCVVKVSVYSSLGFLLTWVRWPKCLKWRLFSLHPAMNLLLNTPADGVWTPAKASQQCMKKQFPCQPGHREAAWAARWMLTPLLSAFCSVWSPQPSVGEVCVLLAWLKWQHSRCAEQKFTSCSVGSEHQKIPSVFFLLLLLPGVLFYLHLFNDAVSF